MVKSTVSQESVKCNACQRSPMGRCLSHTTLPFGKYGPTTFGCLGGRWGWYPTRADGLYAESIPDRDGKSYVRNRSAKTFDEVPLGYLDWLSDQKYVSYGWLRTRLTSYLTRPVIDRELQELFPDPDDDTRRKAFSVLDNMQKREPMPREFLPQLDYEDMPVSYARAWAIVADAINSLESMNDVNDFLDLDAKLIAKAVQMLGKWSNFTAIKTLREAYRTCKLRLQAIPAERTTSIYDYQEPGLADKKKLRKARRKKLFRIRRRNGYIVSIERK